MRNSLHVARGAVTKIRERVRNGRLRRLAAYGASRTLVEGLLSARGIALATVVGPATFGVWALFRLALRYGGLLALGVHRGVEVEVAGADGVGAARDRLGWGRAATGYLVVVYSGLGILAVAASFHFASPARETLLAVGAGLLIERLWVYGCSHLRAQGYLRRYAAIELSQAVLSLTLTVLLALWLGLTGAYAGYLLAMAVGIGLFASRVPFRPKLSWRSVRRLLGVGVPVSIAGVATTMLTTVDRLIVAGLEGTEALGFYAFAVAASGVGAFAALAVRTVVFPDVYAHARREGGRLAAAIHLEDTVVPVARLLPPILGFVALAFGPAIALVAPRYLTVLPVARVFVFSGVAAGIMNLGTVGLVATERQKFLPFLTLGGLAFNALTATAALLGGLGLMGVAAGALVSRSLTGVGIVAVTSPDSAAGHPARLLVRLLWPLAWCTGVVSLIGWLRPDPSLAATAVSALAYLLALTPMIPELVREMGRLNRLGHRG